MRAWNLDITVGVPGRGPAVCHATVFAETELEARADGRELIEAVWKPDELRVSAIDVTPAHFTRSLTMSPLRRAGGAGARSSLSGA